MLEFFLVLLFGPLFLLLGTYLAWKAFVALIAAAFIKPEEPSPPKKDTQLY